MLYGEPEVPEPVIVILLPAVTKPEIVATEPACPEVFAAIEDGISADTKLLNVGCAAEPDEGPANTVLAV